MYGSAPVCCFGLYTILPLPKWYGVWYTKGKPGRGRMLRKSRVIVLQSCEQCRWAGPYQVDCLVQESFGVNEYRVKANSCSCSPIVVPAPGSINRTAPTQPPCSLFPPLMYLEVPRSYSVSAIGKFALLMYMSEFRLRVSSC